METISFAFSLYITVVCSILSTNSKVLGNTESMLKKVQSRYQQFNDIVGWPDIHSLMNDIQRFHLGQS